VTGADWIQLAIAAFAAIAAGAAWEAALTSRDSARQIRIGHLMEVHSGRLAALRELRSRMSWITEGGGPRATLTRAEQWAVSMGIPPGTTIVRGVELAGLVKSTGLALPNCLAVAEVMQQKKIGGPIKGGARGTGRCDGHRERRDRRA
jgi:hypothetical protein